MMKITKHQKFKIEEISRSQIKNAPYNPRTISDEAKKRLRNNLKKVGLLQPIVWNKKTGNLVSGHQRIGILDSLEGNSAYSMQVAVVELDEKTEKEQNLFMNNPKAQGEFNWDGDLNVFQDIDWKEAGFDTQQASWLTAVQETEDLQTNRSEEEIIDSINRIKEVKKGQKKNDFESYIIITFKDQQAKNDFLIKYGYEEEEKYLSGVILEQQIASIKKNNKKA